MKTITYKGITITKTFPQGVYRFYSRKDQRFLYFDTLEGAKMYIAEFWQEL